MAVVRKGRRLQRAFFLPGAGFKALPPVAEGFFWTTLIGTGEGCCFKPSSPSISASRQRAGPVALSASSPSRPQPVMTGLDGLREPSRFHRQKRPRKSGLPGMNPASSPIRPAGRRSGKNARKVGPPSLSEPARAPSRPRTSPDLVRFLHHPPKPPKKRLQPPPVDSPAGRLRDNGPFQFTLGPFGKRTIKTFPFNSVFMREASAEDGRGRATKKDISDR